MLGHRNKTDITLYRSAFRRLQTDAPTFLFFFILCEKDMIP